MKLVALPLVLLALLAAGCGSSGSCNTRATDLVIRAVPQRGQQLTPAGMQLARQIVDSRVQLLGVSSPSVTLRGADEIVVHYAGSNAKPDVAPILAEPGQLQVFDFEKDLAPPTVDHLRPTPYPTLYSLLWTVRAEAAKGAPEAYYLFGFRRRAKEQYPVLHGPDPTRKALLAPYRGKQPSGTTILAVPAHREVVSGPVATAATRPVGRSPDGREWYLFRIDPTAPNGPPEIGDNGLDESAIAAGDASAGDGQPEVTLGFTSHGVREFRAITKGEYGRGRLVAGLHGSASRFNPLYAQHNAIVVDNKVEATPYVDYTINAFRDGIVGNAVIADMGSIAAAKNLALVLKSGSLPYLFKQVSLGPACLR